MSTFTSLNSEVHNYETLEVPESSKSCSSAQAIRANNRHFQLATASSNSQNSGGVLLWNIPPTRGSIARQTMYIRARVSVNTTTASTNTTALNTCTFKGAGGDLAGDFIADLSNGYSWIRRLTLYGTGSSVVDQMNYVNETMNLMLAHNSNGYYILTDGNAMLGCNRGFTQEGAGTASYIDVCLPIPLACFNSDQDFPLYLCNNPMTLQLDLENFARAIFCATGLGGTDYTVKNAYLCYEVLELPASLIDAERSAVNSGHPFIMPLQSWMNVAVNQSVLSSYTLGLNASSLRAVFVLPTDASAYASSTLAGSNYSRVALFSDTAQTYGSGVNAQLYLDGNVKNSSIYDNPVMQFAQLKQAIHNNVQGSIIMPSIASFDRYLTNYFALGWDCTSWDDEATVFGGSPVTNVNIQLTGLGNNANYMAYILCRYDTLLAFKADGIMEVKR